MIGSWAGHGRARWPAAVLAALALAGAAGAQAPPPDARVRRQLTLEVRSALVSDLTDRLSAATGIRLEAERDIGAERVTLYATRARLDGLQNALAALYRSGWLASEAGDRTRYRLKSHAGLLAQAEQVRARRRGLFLARLYDLERTLARVGPEQTAAQLRGNLSRRRPELGPAELGQITPAYVAQAQLLLPLRFGLAPELLRTGVAAQPFARLSSIQRDLFSRFYLAQAASLSDEDAPPGGAPDPAALSWPRARLEYRLLYGDRSAGLILLGRTGTSDSWATAVFTSAAFDLPDYASLYPEAAVRPVDADLYRRLDLQIEAGASWDQALGALSRAAGINLLSDSYLRPEAFAPSPPALNLRGVTLMEALEALARRHHCVWWKSGDWYLFRSRQWADERRVAVPDRAVRLLGQSLAGDTRASSESLAGLAALTDEQLLTLHLHGSAAGQRGVRPQDFDYDEVTLARAGLTIFAQLAEGQREMARAEGIPYVLLNPVQQFLFDNLAYDRGLDLDPRSQARWRFAVRDDFERRRLPTGWAEVGSVSLDFDCAAHGVRTASLAVRTPAFDRPARGAP
jgi:hypothetical protein